MFQVSMDLQNQRKQMTLLFGVILNVISKIVIDYDSPVNSAQIRKERMGEKGESNREILLPGQIPVDVEYTEWIHVAAVQLQKYHFIQMIK